MKMVFLAPPQAPLATHGKVTELALRQSQEVAPTWAWWNPHSDHSGYVKKCGSGSTEMITLDLLLGKYYDDSIESLILKIDVEGQEKAVFLGGRGTILSYKNVIVFLEIMPKVLERENSSAEDIFQTAESIRKFDWVLSDYPYTKIDRSKPFSEQFGASIQRDVIGISVG